MDHKEQQEVALHRWAVIAEAAGARLTAAERGALVRQIAARAHTHPDGSARRYSRGTVDRWLRAWRAGGLEALKPSPRADTGVVRAHPEPSCAAPGCTGRRWPPRRRPTAGMRRPARTSGGSPTCWSARGCRSPGGRGRCGPGCS